MDTIRRSPLRTLIVAPPLWGLMLLLGGAGCLRAPKQAYAIDQIQQIESLEEIMRVQAQTMDPLFRMRGQATFSKDELARFAEAARQLTTTAGTVRDRFARGRKPSFQSYAEALSRSAADLLAAAEGGDSARATAALSAARDACRGCHHDNR